METKDVILRLREERGLTQSALAQEVFVTRQAVSRWETGETLPETQTLKLLSRLEDRGFVAREKAGRGNRYRPLVRREEYLAAESRSFLERLHGGSLPSLVASLMESRSLSEQEVAELEAILKGGEPHA